MKVRRDQNSFQCMDEKEKKNRNRDIYCPYWRKKVKPIWS